MGAPDGFREVADPDEGERRRLRRRPKHHHARIGEAMVESVTSDGAEHEIEQEHGQGGSTSGRWVGQNPSGASNRVATGQDIMSGHGAADGAGYPKITRSAMFAHSQSRRGW